jgi:hypothetical protein
MASLRLLYFFVATAPRIAAPKSTDSLSLGRTIGQPAKIINVIHYFQKAEHRQYHTLPFLNNNIKQNTDTFDHPQ